MFDIFFLKKLRGTNSRNEKIRILLHLKSHDQSGDFARMLKYTLNPFITFGIGESLVISDRVIGFKTLANDGSRKMFFALLDKLAARKLTGNDAHKELSSFIQGFQQGSREIMLCVINRDLEAGCSTSTINAVWPNLIPEYELQKAVAIDDKHIHLLDEVDFKSGMFAEFKYDGFRMTTVNRHKQLIQASYSGLEKEFPSIKKALSGILRKYPMIALDGEVVHKDGFQASMTQVNRKHDKDDSDLCYMVFDCFDYNCVLEHGTDATPLFKRRINLVTMLGGLDPKSPVQVIPSPLIKSRTEADDLYEKYITLGYEGMMLKNPRGVYQCKRTKDWLKRKPTETMDCEVLGILEGAGQFKGKLGSVSVRMDSGKVSNVAGFKLKDREIFFKHPNKIIGKIIEVKYDRLTDEGKFRFARFQRIRTDKR